MKFHARKKELCVARSKTCKDCGTLNHLVCPGKHTKPVVHEVDELFVDLNDNYFLYIKSVAAIGADDCPRKIFASMRLINNHFRFQLDYSATVNIVPVDEYERIANDPALDKLNNPKMLQMFNKTTLKTLGTVNFEIVNPRNDEALTLEFVFVKSHMPY